MAEDFGPLGSAPAGEKKTKKDGVFDSGGSKRKWLKVFETPPVQMLNAYGEAKYAKMSDPAVWEQLSKPLKTGAEYMTELCSLEAERRGVGINRFLHALISYLEHQTDTEIRKRNEVVLDSAKCKELYEEINQLLPSLKYCLAPRKTPKKEGAASLRASAVAPVVSGPSVSKPELDKHARIIHDWLAGSKPSRIRMLLHWQSAGGLSHVASVYHRTAQCFVKHGNKFHEGIPGEVVTLQEFQEGIRCRHELGDAGMDDSKAHDDQDYK
jgi:hypothetical protein